MFILEDAACHSHGFPSVQKGRRLVKPHERHAYIDVRKEKEYARKRSLLKKPSHSMLILAIPRLHYNP
jgi:hypothetical protein